MAFLLAPTNFSIIREYIKHTMVKIFYIPQAKKISMYGHNEKIGMYLTAFIPLRLHPSREHGLRNNTVYSRKES